MNKTPMIITPSMDVLARAMWQHATAGDYFYDGRNPQTSYFQAARQLHVPTGTGLLFTRDVGHHASGWFKNPDYERCYHLSLSFWDLKKERPRPYENGLAKLWVQAFYGKWIRFVWEEGSKLKRTPDTPEVRHYRIFCDPAWQPIIPKGEVYSKADTEIWWKSWSEQQGDRTKEVEGDEE